MSRAQAAAYAKINLGLRILGRRRDGFHELRTVFQTISLADTVTLEFRPGRGVRLDHVQAGAEVGWPDMPDTRNLAVRAAEWAREEFRIRGQIGVRLTKRIPVGAGLGGGSADAAAVLRLLAARARPQPPAGAVRRLAASLGSDVPALLWGGTVLGLGRGEECYRLPALPAWHCVLAMPEPGRCPTLPQGISTEAAYRRWDELHPNHRPDGLTGAEISASMDALLGSLQRIRQMHGGSVHRAAPASRDGRDRGHRWRPKVRAGIENDFAEAVFPLSPDFSAIRRALQRGGASCIGLSGSGAAQYGLFAARAQAAAARARLAPRVRGWTARFIAPRPRAHGSEERWGVVQR